MTDRRRRSTRFAARPGRGESFDAARPSPKPSGGTSSLAAAFVPRRVSRNHLRTPSDATETTRPRADAERTLATDGGSSDPNPTDPDVPAGGGAETLGDGDRSNPAREGSLRLSSPAFDDGETLPTRFTCAGEGVSPPLEVAGVPGETEALALVVDDPDAPREEPFVHWLLWNLPAETTSIPEGVPTGESVLDGARQGSNDGGEAEYYPACPPEGDDPHAYRFTLYALDDSLDVEGDARRAELERAVETASVGEARLTGTFERSG